METEKKSKVKKVAKGCLFSILGFIVLIIILGIIAVATDDGTSETTETTKTVEQVTLPIYESYYGNDYVRDGQKCKVYYALVPTDITQEQKELVFFDIINQDGFQYHLVTVAFHDREVEIGGFTPPLGMLEYLTAEDKKSKILTYTPGDYEKNPEQLKARRELHEKQLAEQAALPTEYKNALAKAQVYVDTMYMSEKELYEQLTSEYGEQFTKEAAQYAIENVITVYDFNALMKARQYQNQMQMSKKAIYDQLVSEYGEQFTPSQAQYAIDNL